MKIHMIRKYMYLISFLMVLPVSLFGCGQKDKLVMVTTEKNKGDDSLLISDETATVDELTSEEITEEATAEEKAVTIEEIEAANSGDVLLAEGKGCSAATIYYSAGTEVYSENRFLGFGDDGQYMQAYQDYNGDIEVLDNYNQCWYVLSDGDVYVKLCPEDGVSARLIDYNHKHTVVAPYDNEEIQNVYRNSEYLIVETTCEDNSGDAFTYKYYMKDGLKVDEIYCYDSSGEKFSYERITETSDYNTPDELMDLLEGNAETRLVQVIYPDGDGMGNIYTVPKQYPLVLDLYQYQAYSDAACTTPWEESALDVNGQYIDSVIYLKNK